MSRLGLLLLGCCGAIQAVAAPPPPPLYPDDLPQSLSDYDLSLYYSRYAHWLEGQKGKVIDGVMAEVPSIPGYRPVFGPVASYRLFSDYGHFVSGEVRGYCRGDASWSDWTDCLFVFRAVSVPPPVLDREGPLGGYMRRSFDPAALVAGLEVQGIGVNADVWRIDGDKAFAALGSPLPVLAAHAHIERVDSRQCPVMLDELQKLDQAELTYRTDLPLIGRDGLFEPPAPHSVMREDKLNFRTRGGMVTVTAGQNDLYHLLKPLYASIEGCLRRNEGAAE